MENNGIEVDLFPLVFERKKFDFKKYFANVIKLRSDDFDERYYEPIEKLEDFNIRLRRRETRK